MDATEDSDPAEEWPLLPIAHMSSINSSLLGAGKLW